MQINFMNHHIKTLIFKTLNTLPNKLGYSLYHQMQNFSENKNIEAKIKSTENTFNAFLNICSELKIDVKHKSVIEIGSGWLPIIPYFLIFKSNVRNVFTFDLYKHYQRKEILAFNSIFSKIYDYTIIPEVNNKFDLPTGVNYYPFQNIVYSEIPKAKIIFSRFVLEHITPEDIFEMHKKFKSSLNKGCYIVHFISPSDHRAYSDKSLSLQDFLKYSEKDWNKIQTKFDYHNRLRLPQYLEIFKSLDLEIAYISYDSIKNGSSQYDLFKKLEIHKDYKIYSEEELTAGSINIVLKI